MDEVVAGYRELTGDVPMFGKWVYGFWQSKERYKSFDELKAVVKEYRKRGIPLDNIVQDWEYWGDKPHWNSLTFHPANFNHPRQVIDELHQQDHVHFMLSVWPGFGPETAVYQSLDSIGALFSEPTWAGYKVLMPTILPRGIFSGNTSRKDSMIWVWMLGGWMQRNHLSGMDSHS